jgi:hypothetical protein
MANVFKELLEDEQTTNPMNKLTSYQGARRERETNVVLCEWTFIPDDNNVKPILMGLPVSCA